MGKCLFVKLGQCVVNEAGQVLCTASQFRQVLHSDFFVRPLLVQVFPQLQTDYLQLNWLNIIIINLWFTRCLHLSRMDAAQILAQFFGCVLFKLPPNISHRVPDGFQSRRFIHTFH